MTPITKKLTLETNWVIVICPLNEEEIRLDVRCIKSLLQAGARVNAFRTCPEEKANLEITHKMPPQVIRLLFVAGEIFTRDSINQLDEVFHKHAGVDGADSEEGGVEKVRSEMVDEDQDVHRDLQRVSWQDWWESKRGEISPECFEQLSLTKESRLAVRNHLLKLDLHSNLFQRIPLLGLPKIMTNYLLYGAKLDDKL